MHDAQPFINEHIHLSGVCESMKNPQKQQYEKCN